MKRILLRATTIFFLIAMWTGLAAAQQPQGWGTPPAGGAQQQQPPQQQPQSASSDSNARTNVDETFELNITERRITERDFAAKTSVEAGEESARGLRLRIGVEVGASEIDVLLRNVRGSVRFRATLDRVLDLINARRAPESAP